MYISRDTSARHMPPGPPNPSIRFLRQALLIKRTRTNDWTRLAEKVACRTSLRLSSPEKCIELKIDLHLRPEGETPLQWMTKECLLANAGVKLRKVQNEIEIDENLQMEGRVFRYFSMPVA